MLAGLVAITAPCAFIQPWHAAVIGTIAGVLVIEAIFIVEKRFKIDDPVGAISVHGVCGSFGTLAAALFHENLFLGKEYNLMQQLTTQGLGVATAFLWTFGTAFVLFKVIAMTVGLRVSDEEQIAGLDIEEHGANAYPDFVHAIESGGLGAPKPTSLGHVPVTERRPAEASN
jgi:Amt family ammonium transporter